jgi:hypothetical protein
MKIALILMTFVLIYESAQSVGSSTSGEAQGVWKRLDEPVFNLKLATNEKRMAYTDEKGKSLRVVEFETGASTLLTLGHVDQSFFWAPDDCRLIYREIGQLATSGEEQSLLKSYDCVVKDSTVLETLSYRTGFLTFDPRDMRLFLMHSQGILARKLEFLESRLARWQRAQRTEDGRWVVAQNGVLWVTHGGLSMRKMIDDHSGIDSFSISPDGGTIAWATVKGAIYLSRLGEEPLSIGFGRDPHWHPLRPLLVYSGARMVGKVVADYDLRIVDNLGSGRWLTQTPVSQERWPQWRNPKQIVYTKVKSTDLFVLDL